jgi:hypothetical protein
MTDEPKVFTLLREYDEMRVQMRRMEKELNDECISFARSKGCAYFFPQHIRNIVQLTKKEQVNA